MPRPEESAVSTRRFSNEEDSPFEQAKAEIHARNDEVGAIEEQIIDQKAGWDKVKEKWDREANPTSPIIYLGVAVVAYMILK